MHLTHKIALRPTTAHENYFRRAAGTARFVWNWGLAACYRQREAGLRPNPMDLKKGFNAIKYFEFPCCMAVERFLWLGRWWKAKAW
jgi:putative transposase